MGEIFTFTNSTNLGVQCQPLKLLDAGSQALHLRLENRQLLLLGVLDGVADLVTPALGPHQLALAGGGIGGFGQLGLGLLDQRSHVDVAPDIYVYGRIGRDGEDSAAGRQGFPRLKPGERRDGLAREGLDLHNFVFDKAVFGLIGGVNVAYARVSMERKRKTSSENEKGGDCSVRESAAYLNRPS